MLQTDIAYVAGIVDGEGCIRVKKSKAYRCQGRATPGYHAMIAVKMVDQEAIEFCCRVLDGWWFSGKSSLRSGRPFFTLQLSDMKAENACRLLLPYLKTKRRQAENVLSLRDHQKESGIHKTKVVGFRNFPNKYGTPRQVPNLSFSDEYVAKCEAFYLESRRLNRVGIEAVD